MLCLWGLIESSNCQRQGISGTMSKSCLSILVCSMDHRAIVDRRLSRFLARSILGYSDGSLAPDVRIVDLREA